MKKLLLFVLLTSFTFGYGQNLSLSQLMSLRTMNLDDAEVYLTQMGWSYKESKEETDNTLGLVSFVYGTNGAFGESYLVKMFSNYGTKILVIQIGKQSKYLEYLNAVKSFNPQLIEDSKLVKTYQSAVITVKFETVTVKTSSGNDKTSWVLRIYSNEDYKTL